MAQLNVGQSVRLKVQADRKAGDKKKPPRSGKVVELSRALAGDGKSEVVNAAVQFGEGAKAVTELHESSAFVAA